MAAVAVAAVSVVRAVIQYLILLLPQEVVEVRAVVVALVAAAADQVPLDKAITAELPLTMRMSVAAAVAAAVPVPLVAVVLVGALVHGVVMALMAFNLLIVDLRGGTQVAVVADQNHPATDLL